MIKLVRDKIPEIILADNAIPTSHRADTVEYESQLKKKLSEEVNEYLEDDNPEELADIMEVLYAIFELKGHTKEEIEAIRLKKATERGTFTKKIILTDIKNKD